MKGFKPTRRTNKKLLLIVGAAILAIAVIVGVISLLPKDVLSGANGDEIKGIYLVSAPSKTKYYLGQSADYSGLEIQVLKNNGDSEIIAYSEQNANLFEISGFSTDLTTDKQVVTVKYEGFTCAFNISVVEQQKPTPVLAAISIHTMPKTVYSLSAGDWLDVSSGMILKEYTDGSTSLDVILYQYVVGWQEAYDRGVGTHTLTIEFVENGVLKTTTFDVTIIE